MLISKYSPLFLCLSALVLSSALLCLGNDVSVLKTELTNQENQRQRYEQCVWQCEEMQLGRPEECQRFCEERERKREGESGREPQRREECERRCSWETQSQRERQQCEQQCREQSRGREGRQSEEVGDKINQKQDPRRRFEECSQSCERQERGRQQEECQRRCREEYQEEEQRQEREHRRGGGDDSEKDPRCRYEECQEQCRRQEGSSQQQCQKRCQEEYEREREESESRRGRGDEDPARQRYEECQRQCQEQARGQEQQQCQRRCQEDYERERQESEGRRHRGEQEPAQEYEECKQRCRQTSQRQRGPCQRRCDRQYREEQEQGRGRREEEVGGAGEEQEQSNNPYYFHSQRFQERFRSSQGSLRVLPKFTSRSRLLRGIKNFRFAELVVSPNTFVLPHHSDSDSICVVTRGRGTITFVNHERKESYNIQQGNVIRVPSGNTLYLINHESNEELNIAIFVNPVNIPGRFQDLYPAGGESPQPYYRAFSTEILEQALNTPREELERLFQGQERQQQGIFRRASQQQLQAMSRNASSPKSKGRDMRSPIDLMNQKPVYSNQNGRFFEATPDEFGQLEDIEVSVGIADLKQDAMFAPHYNSRKTTVVYVANGEGLVEIVCPHLSRRGMETESRGRRREEYGGEEGRREEEEEEEEEEERSGEIQRLSARISAGDIFVIPVSHPFTMVATGNQNLTTVGFGINARNNERIFLAGRENLMREMDSEAKELAFGVQAKLVDQIFNNAKESYIVSSAESRGRQRRDNEEKTEAGPMPLSSILELARLF